MTLMKSALLASATTIIAVAGAQAADLPSKKAAPVNYVKICDAYGAGFFTIPGTDTCVKLGGYVRAEYQYVPAQKVYKIDGTELTANNSVLSAATNTNTVYSAGKTADETGYEMRGRIDVDARTPTAMGPARTFVRLRGANTSGIRNTAITNVQGYTMSAASTTALSLETASVQWAGFTFGVAPENYAMMPSHFYNANPWTGFPNGMKQIAFTAQLGGGLTATLALEDRRDHTMQAAADRAATAGVIVGNLRLDQSWGFAAIHGMVGNNDYYVNAAGAAISSVATGMYAPSASAAADTKSKSAFAVGSTMSVKLPMIAPGDQLWITANYSEGILSALMSAGGLSNVNTPANKRLLGGLVRADNAMGFTTTTTVDNVTGWNVAAAFTHYWAAQWRSNFSAGYIEINPPKSTATANPVWGKGQLQVYTGGLIYSPVSNLDIGIEVQYASVKNKIQNPSTAYLAAGSPGLNESNFTTKLRVERTF
jgi:hypothetical protein